MAILYLGNENVIERRKLNPDLDDSAENTETVARPDLGRRVTTMNLNEVDGDDNPSRAMNLTLATRFWAGNSSTPPAWVDSPDDRLLAELVADHYGCPVGRPETWMEG